MLLMLKGDYYMIEDKNTVTQETLEDARQKASTLAEILFLGLFQAPSKLIAQGILIMVELSLDTFG